MLNQVRGSTSWSGSSGACQVVVDILSRFDFEQALFAGRRERGYP